MVLEDKGRFWVCSGLANALLHAALLFLLLSLLLDAALCSMLLLLLLVCTLPLRSSHA